MNKKKNLNLIVGLFLAGLVVLLVLVGVFWTPYDPLKMSLALKLKPPSLTHLFGTDNYGRDIFSRVMSGTGTTYFVALCTVIIGVFFGTVIGLISGYIGGWFDEIVMRFNDMLTAFPSILLALILVSLIGPGKFNIILALGFLYIPSFARIVRSEMIRLKERGFVKSAKLIGASKFNIIFRHILPNAMPSILTATAVGFNNAVLAEAGMSYLGLGVQPPEASLGRMLLEAQSFLFNAPWYAIFPGLMIVIIILGFSLISEGLGDKNA